MPIYAYECKNCGVRFERRQSFNDDPITVCPECEGEVHRLIQPAGIVFKGSGFYVTDHRGSKSTLSGNSRAESKSEGKAETKPAASEKSSKATD
jgi:putative FmdB family regulatory protein